jgi:FAD synthetase
VPIRDIDPDIIVLGHDQHHDEETLAAMLEEEGIDCAVARASAREPEYDGEVLSTGRIIDRVCDRRC